ESAPPVRVALAVALTKGGIDDVVKAVTELGVARVTPVVAERSVVRWDADRARAAHARLGAIAREAAMQSRRATIPAVGRVVGFEPVRPGAGLAGPRPGGRPRRRACAPGVRKVDGAGRTRRRLLGRRAHTPDRPSGARNRAPCAPRRDGSDRSNGGARGP